MDFVPLPLVLSQQSKLQAPYLLFLLPSLYPSLPLRLLPLPLSPMPLNHPWKQGHMARYLNSGRFRNTRSHTSAEA